MNNIILKTCDLSVWYNELQALKNINIDIISNKVTALIGPSGCGKSTFLRSLNRMLDIIAGARVEGKVFFHNNNIYDSNTDVIELRRKIGMVFQNPTPFLKSIYDNIAYGLTIDDKFPKKANGFFKRLFNRKVKGEDVEKSKHGLDLAVVRSLKEAALWEEVKDRLQESAFRLSGGQQQRLCIARAIAVKPSIILFDEPTSELDPIATRKIEELILELKSEYTVVIVTHNLQQAKRISDYAAFFHLGELIEFNENSKIFNNADHPLTYSYVQGKFG